jgi:hypothetical protein
MSSVSQGCTCAFYSHSSNLGCLVSWVLHASPFSMVQCAGAFSPAPSDAGTNEVNECANNSNENPRRIKPVNAFATVALFFNLLASVLAIVVSVLKLLEMTNQP